MQVRCLYVDNITTQLQYIIINDFFFFLATVKRNSWSTPERHSARVAFRREIIGGTIPSSARCETVTVKYPELKSRTVAQIKSWVQGEINRNCKKEFTVMQHFQNF